MKSEPDVFGLAHLQQRPHGTAPWDGVRNYQARNFMRAMQVSDRVLFYHSSCPIPGVAGVAEIVGPARSDDSQFDKKSEFYDAGAKRDNPRWSLVDVKFVAEFPKFVPLPTLREQPALKKNAPPRPRQPPLRPARHTGGIQNHQQTRRLIISW